MCDKFFGVFVLLLGLGLFLYFIFEEGLMGSIFMFWFFGGDFVNGFCLDVEIFLGVGVGFYFLEGDLIIVVFIFFLYWVNDVIECEWCMVFLFVIFLNFGSVVYFLSGIWYFFVLGNIFEMSEVRLLVGEFLYLLDIDVLWFNNWCVVFFGVMLFDFDFNLGWGEIWGDICGEVDGDSFEGIEIDW